jgi:hypothetical protein
MDGPSPLVSNGLPYVLDSFTITGTGASTAAFDQAEASGEPLVLRPAEPPTEHQAEMPLDLSIVRFAPAR